MVHLWFALQHPTLDFYSVMGTTAVTAGKTGDDALTLWFGGRLSFRRWNLNFFRHALDERNTIRLLFGDLADKSLSGPPGKSDTLVEREI